MAARISTSSQAREYVKKKLPSMYHQFKNLPTSTSQGPMEVATAYMMGGIRVDAETTQSTILGLFAAVKRRWPSRLESSRR